MDSAKKTTPPWIVIPTNELEEIKDQLNILKQFVKLALSNIEDKEEYYTSHQVQKLLQISRKTLEKYRSQKMFDYIYVGNLIRYKKSSINIFLEKHTIKGGLK